MTFRLIKSSQKCDLFIKNGMIFKYKKIKIKFKDLFEWALNEDLRKKNESEKSNFILKSSGNIEIKSPDEFYSALERYNTLLETNPSIITSKTMFALEKAIEDFWPKIYPNE
jgi:hypothetical protein